MTWVIHVNTAAGPLKVHRSDANLETVELHRTSATRGEAPTPYLSKSEINCLLWSARGKTSFEISKILSLSEHTINHYFLALASKLSATNRTHAVAKALKLGIITPEQVF
ncbi:MAG: helix-turn-helix transcriptional regulator [Pseudomonadota bacterium]